MESIISAPSEFHYRGCSFSFDSIEIYHCLDDNSRYVFGVFSYNSARKRFIKFRHRRNKDNSWGSLVGKINCNPLSNYHGRSWMLIESKMKPNSHNIANKDKYLEYVCAVNENRVSRGLKEIKPLNYAVESCDAQRVIIDYTIQTLKRYYGPTDVEISINNILNAHEKLCAGVVLNMDGESVALETSSSSLTSFSVVCLDCEGYEGHFVTGETYVATKSDGDMIVVESDDGIVYRMFEDRFSRV